MSKSTLPFKEDLYYDSIVYRDIARNVLAGLKEISEKQRLSVHYSNAFHQVAGIYEMLLISLGYFDDNEECTAEDIETATVVTEHLVALSEKHCHHGAMIFEPWEIEDIVNILHAFADGKVDIENHQTDILQDANELLFDFWLTLDKECKEVGIDIHPCFIITQVSYKTQ